MRSSRRAPGAARAGAAERVRADAEQVSAHLEAIRKLQRVAASEAARRFPVPLTAPQVSAACGELRAQIRSEVHTGECELIDDDLAELAVSIGARIGALAGAGEVLVSSTVTDLAVGSGLSFPTVACKRCGECRASGGYSH